MLIAIEGIDGSGKGTQTAQLAKRAEESGLSVSVFSFPGYAKNVFGEAIGRYLNGEFGDVDAVARHNSHRCCMREIGSPPARTCGDDAASKT